ncbi:MAG: hypothetical protein ACYS8Z_03720 [Planctomycetota bacterium]
MEISEVRSVAGKLAWVGRTPKTHHYRGWFYENPDCRIICRRYPVLLTFDNDAILVDYRRDRSEELRRYIKRRIDRQLRLWDDCHDCCDDCDHDRHCGYRGPTYSGRRQIGADIYRTISGHGEATLVP